MHKGGGRKASRAEGSRELKNERMAHLAPVDRWRIEFAPTDASGTHQYLCRLYGIVSRVSVGQSRFGPRVRLYGRFVARRPNERCEAPIVLVPVALADLVTKAFTTHPPNSTRDRIRVWVDFDLWALKTYSVVGFDVICDGEVWVPEPLKMLEAVSMLRAFPKSPVGGSR